MSNSNTPSHKTYLRPKQQIGSCKFPISFKQSQTAFHHDDIPAAKRERKNEVKQWARARILGIEQQEWKNGTKFEKPVCERRRMENFVHDRSRPYQYNFRAEVLPDKLPPPIDKSTKFHISAQDKDTVDRLQRQIENDQTGILKGKFHSTMEMPVNPKLESRGDWNVSTEVISSHLNQSALEFTKRSLNSTKKQYESLYGTRTNSAYSSTFGSTTNTHMDTTGGSPPQTAASAPSTSFGGSRRYVSPIQTSVDILEEVRRKKANGTFSTKYNVFQKLEEPVDRTKLVNRFAIEPTRKYKVTEHSGKWEFNPVEGRHMWSDTGSFIYESRGDIVHGKNPLGYNYASPTMSMPAWMGGAKTGTGNPKNNAASAGNGLASGSIGDGNFSSSVFTSSTADASTASNLMRIGEGGAAGIAISSNVAIPTLD